MQCVDLKSVKILSASFRTNEALSRSDKDSGFGGMETMVFSEAAMSAWSGKYEGFTIN